MEHIITHVPIELVTLNESHVVHYETKTGARVGGRRSLEPTPHQHRFAHRCFAPFFSLQLPLFWRSYLTDEVINQLPLEQLRAFYLHPLLNLETSSLCLPQQLETNMIRSALHLYMVTIQNHGLRDLWFASYSLSVSDSKRSELLDSELCSPNGFDVYFKIEPNDVIDPDFLDTLQPYEDDPDLLLYPHSICHFHHDSRAFTMELKDDGPRHHTDLKWRRPDGRSVRVAHFPPLLASRKPNDWGWKLENTYVVLYARPL